MVGWHHLLDGHEFEQAPGVGDGPGGLVCCSPWGHKELDMTEQLNNNIKKWDQEEAILLNVKTGGQSFASDEGKKQKPTTKNCGQELALANHEIFTWNNPVVHASLKAQIVQMNVLLILYLHTVSMVSLKVS